MDIWFSVCTNSNYYYGICFVGLGRSGVPCTTANQCKTMHAGQPSARPSLAGVELERVCSYHGLGTNPDH